MALRRPGRDCAWLDRRRARGRGGNFPGRLGEPLEIRTGSLQGSAARERFAEVQRPTRDDRQHRQGQRCGLRDDDRFRQCRLRGQYAHSWRGYVLLLLRPLQAQVQCAAGALSGRKSIRARVMINRIIDLSVKYKFFVLASVAIACVFGWWAMMALPLDATPDLSETQVIIYSRWDRSPDIVEDQVTYPIVTAMLGAPRVKAIRGFSDFGFSFVYIIFEEGTDIYWARSRTLEYLSRVLPRLPLGVNTEIGPDATGVGWVFQYALVDTTGKHSLAELRSVQDWFLRYHLQSVPGVAEVAPLGGFVRQYQVNVDPDRLRAFNLPISKVVDAVRTGNNDVGGRLVEMSGAEYMVRGRGYAKSTDDIGRIVLASSSSGVPIRVKDVGHVVLGPDLRRGIADWNGQGDTVTGRSEE